MYSDNILKQCLYLSCSPLFFVLGDIMGELIEEIKKEIEEIKKIIGR